MWDVKILVTKLPHPEAVVDIVLTTVTKQTIEFHAMAMRKNKLILAELRTPIRGFNNVQLEGTLTPLEDNKVHLVGRLSQSTKMYNIDGTIEFADEVTVAVALQFQPMNGIGGDGELKFSLGNPQEREIVNVGTGLQSVFSRSVKIEITADETFIKANADLSVYNKVNWKSRFNMLASKGFLSPDSDANRVDLEAIINTNKEGRIMSNLEIATPWKNLGIGSIMVATNMSIASSRTGEIRSIFTLQDLTGSSSSGWTFHPTDDIQMFIDNTVKRKTNPPRIFKAGVKYLNNANHNSLRKNSEETLRLAVSISTILNIDNRWWFESNKTLTTTSGDYSAALSVRMPKPIGDVHRINGRFKGTLATITDNVSYEVRYETDESRKRFASRGQYRNVTDMQGVVRAEWGTEVHQNVAEANMQMLRKGVRRELSARIVTPLYAEDTLSGSGSFDLDGHNQLIV